MNEIRVSIWNVLRPVLVTGMVVLSALACDTGSGGGNSKKSSEAKMTALTVTVGDADYTAHISGDTATVTLPGGTAIPGSVTVKSVTLSAKATGLAANDRLTLTDGRATVTITAEDGATVAYTIVIQALTVTAVEVSKRAATDVRDSYGLFSITANEDVADYYLAVKETGEPTPTTQEMTDHGLKRDLSSTAITVLIAQRMDAPMITFAKAYFDDPTQKNLGDGMTGHFQSDEQASFFDGDDSNSPYVEAPNPWIEGSVLQPETGYTLYGMGDGAVQALLAFTTDASPASWTRQEAGRIGVDTTVDADNGLILTLNSDEYYIIPLQVITQDSLDVTALDVSYSQKTTGNQQLPGPNLACFGPPKSGYEYQLVMFPFQSTFGEAVRNTYVLIDTSRITTGGSSSLEWGVTMSLSDSTATPLYKLKFTIQE